MCDRKSSEKNDAAIATQYLQKKQDGNGYASHSHLPSKWRRAGVKKHSADNSQRQKPMV